MSGGVAKRLQTTAKDDDTVADKGLTSSTASDKHMFRIIKLVAMILMATAVMMDLKMTARTMMVLVA